MAPRPPRRRHPLRAPRPLRTLVVVAVAVALVAASCSDDEPAEAGAGSSSDEPPTETTAPGAPAAAPEEHTGSDEDFYVVPDPLPEGEPGDLIRVQELGEADGAVTWRVMYHSVDAAGRDRAVTGIVTHPTAEPPEGGWPVVATANGTVGLASSCALSRQGGPAPDWGVEGVRVATDYIGMGPVGEIHPYLSRLSEGRSVIDGVRAARALPGSGAGDRWLSIGHSQGGHGALSAAELAEEHAPELELVATLALAPAAMFGETYDDPIDPIVSTIVGVMGLYGAQSEHPDIVFEDYASEAVVAAAPVFETACLEQIITSMAPLAAAPGFWAADPFETEQARSILLANDVGHVAVDAPLLLVSGTRDDRVVIDRVRALYDRLCETGQATELVVVEGADHGSVLPATAEQTGAWLRARLAGEAATDTCGG